MTTVDTVSAVLIVEPDETLALDVSSDLQQLGYHTIVTTTGKTALQQAISHEPALIVVDETLDNQAGAAFCADLRRRGLRIPVLLMMQCEGLEDRVACLESGADDYFLKPYRTNDFLKLVQFYLQTEPPSHEQLRFGDLVLDLGTRQAIRNGRAIDLTMKEFELLKFMMAHPREVMTREKILENVWGEGYLGESNVIEVYIRYLRLKIEEEGEKRLVQTVRGVGYVLREA
jgi:OmpR family response regulator NblR